MPKKYPKVKFIADRSKDTSFILKKCCLNNLKSFLPNEMRYVLGNNFSGEIKKKILRAYTDNYYSVYKDRIQKNLKETEIKWRKKEKIFFKLADKIFNNYPWPKGSYRGYISIWVMFPRFIGQKLFAFPIKRFHPVYKDQDLRVIAHEMLHFIAYDYLQKKYKLKPSERASRDNFFWQFTENLNVLIQNNKMWKPFSFGFESKPYPDCKKLYLKMEKIWRKSHDLDDLIAKTFKLKK